MTQIFISYSHKDRDFVQRLAEDLSERLPELKIFYDMLIQVGDSWADTLATQIEQADIVLAILSPDYLSSVWAQQEINVALERQLAKKGRLFPLLVRPCSPSGYLASLTWIDFTGDYESAIANLVWGITGRKPRSAKGEQPGVPAKELGFNEAESLRQEIKAAVKLFKSRDGQAKPAQPKAKARRTPTGNEKEKECFIVMPFGNQDLQVVYEDFVRPTLIDECGLNCVRGDDIFGSNIIMEDILKSIRSADVILADLTGKNANVFMKSASPIH